MRGSSLVARIALAAGLLPPRVDVAVAPSRVAGAVRRTRYFGIVNRCSPGTSATFSPCSASSPVMVSGSFTTTR